MAGGFLGKAWDSFSGQGAVEALQKGQEKANSLLTSGRDDALGEYAQGYSSATGRMLPYQQGGQQAYQLGMDFMGVNGRPAQTTAMSNYQSSPYMSYLQNQRTNEMMRRANAGGSYYSGNALQAAGNVNQSMAAQDYDTYIQRLLGLGQQGQQTGQFMAGLDTQNAMNRGTLKYGANQQLANNAVSMANAEAQANGTMWNNIMGLGSLGVSAFGAFNPLGSGNVKKGMNDFSMSGYNSGWASPMQRR